MATAVTDKGLILNCEGIVDEFSKCLGYMEHLGKVACDATRLLEEELMFNNKAETRENVLRKSSKLEWIIHVVGIFLQLG